MTGVRAAIFGELESRGYVVSEHDVDLISAGVNSAALIQILSALEDVFEIDLDTERLFTGPVTVARLESEITLASLS
jgi:acyl carrier protein